MEMNTMPVGKNKTATVFSWVGFGVSAGLFLLIWVANLLIVCSGGGSSNGAANGFAGLYMLAFLFGTLLGLLGMVFSIIGLVMSAKNRAPMWMSITGMVLSLLSLISFFFPVIYHDIEKAQTAEVLLPESAGQASEIAEDVTIQINDVGRVRCINNINANNSVIGNMGTYEYDFERQLGDWLKMNNVDSSTGVVIRTSRNADYSDITKVFEALQANGVKRYRIANN